MRLKFDVHKHTYDIANLDHKHKEKHAHAVFDG